MSKGPAFHVHRLQCVGDKFRKEKRVRRFVASLEFRRKSGDSLASDEETSKTWTS